MHGTLFALHYLSFCADLKPIHVSFLVLAKSHQQQSQHHRLGNDFRYFLLTPDLPDFLRMHGITTVYFMKTLHLFTNPGFTHCLNFNFYFLVVPANMFRNPFLIFDLDKQHPWFHEGGLSTD
jgi:hypothetical protein